MTVTYLPHELLRKAAFDLIHECRENIKKGIVDVSEVESSVRNYCESIATLPTQQGIQHKEDLNALMELVTKLGEELVAARDDVQVELGKLERMRKASTAYQSPEGLSKTVAGNDGE